MGDKRKWHSFLAVALVLLVAASVVACAAARSPAVTTAPTVTVTVTASPSLVQTPTATVSVTASPTSTSSVAKPIPSGAVSWDKAKDHVGERVTVYGPVVGATYASSSKGQPTFLNIGKNYPDSARFTVLIWGSDRSKFSPTPEIQYKGKTIHVYGLVQLYQGSAEIVVSSPSQIQVQ